MYGHIEDLCKESNKQRFTCNGSKVVYQASIIWGSIGPQRMFQAGQVYGNLMYFFIIGVSSDICYMWAMLTGAGFNYSPP